MLRMMVDCNRFLHKVRNISNVTFWSWKLTLLYKVFSFIYHIILLRKVKYLRRFTENVKDYRHHIVINSIIVAIEIFSSLINTSPSF